MTDFYATIDIAEKFFKNRMHFNNSRFLIMCCKNTENAPILITIDSQDKIHTHTKFYSFKVQIITMIP